MADYASETSVTLRGWKRRGCNIHRSIDLLNVTLPDEEGNNKEYGNDQRRKDVGTGPSLNRTRRNCEDKKDHRR